MNGLPITHQPQTSPLLADQAADVAQLLRSLNEANRAEEAPGAHPWGDGFHAVIKGPIPVISDAREVTEVLGWIVLGEHEWTFTQIHPTGF